MAQILFYVIVGLIIFDFLSSRIFDYLNNKHRKLPLPEEVANVFDIDEYKKQQEYESTNDKFSVVTETFSLIIILGMLFLGGFAFVDDFARNYSSNGIIVSLIFFGVLMLVYDIISTPFAYYATFVIEEKFGFNKTTIKTFFLDKVKSWLLGGVIGGGLLSLIIYIYQASGEWFWIVAWASVSGFSLFMAMFYSNLIVPLFNKQTPLEDGDLRDAIEKLSTKAGFKLKNIYVIDGSKRSTKANAYFTGLGPKKRIVLYDTLIKDLSTNEIVAVLAHEIGHYKKKHNVSSMVLSILTTGIMFYVFSIFVANPALSEALGATQHGFHLALISFGILYSPFSSIIGIGMTLLSRKNEYQADAFAANFKLGDELISALKNLSKKTLSNLNPHPIVVFFNYSHPTLLQRIRAIKSKQNESRNNNHRR